MTIGELLKVTEEERNSIRKNVGYTSKDQINKDIELVLEWFKKQQHLPRINLDRRLIENLLISRKRSVEQTKQKVDLMFSIRNMIPEIAGPRDVNNIKIRNCLKSCTFVMLPKLNKDLTRVNIFTYKGDVDFFSLIDIMSYVFTIIEHRMLHDCSSGDSYVVDLENLMFGHLTKITPHNVKYSELYIRKAYGIRISAVHFINASSLLNALLAIFKTGMSAKLQKRLHVHLSLEDLYKVVDKNILPVEYGGNERSMAELHESWIKELSKDDIRKYLIEQEKLRSNESLRVGGKMDDEILGIAGSFRKLDVD